MTLYQKPFGPYSKPGDIDDDIARAELALARLNRVKAMTAMLSPFADSISLDSGYGDPSYATGVKKEEKEGRPILKLAYVGPHTTENEALEDIGEFADRIGWEMGEIRAYNGGVRDPEFFFFGPIEIDGEEWSLKLSVPFPPSGCKVVERKPLKQWQRQYNPPVKRVVCACS